VCFQIVTDYVNGCALINQYFSYALPIPKAEAVAQETLAVWCSLASRLGVWALKAELEDFCFAVLQVFVLLSIWFASKMLFS